MHEPPVLTEAAVDEYLSLRPAVAWSDLDALVAGYDCTLDVMNDGLASASPDEPFPDSVRSWVHERQHLFHVVATPFGLFLWRLKSLQTEVVRHVVGRLPELGVPVKLPLLRYVASLEPAIRQELSLPIQVWFAAEQILDHELGTVSMRRLMDFARAWLPPDERFQLLQTNLARQYAYAEHRGPIRDHAEFDTKEFFDERADATKWASIERAVTAIRALASPDVITLPMVIESAGYAAELWGDSQGDVERRLAVAARGDSLLYVVPFQRTASAIKTTDARRRVLTHLTVCDLAMFAPVLPEHRPLRARGLDPDELFPVLRFNAMLSHLAKVEPMRDVDDYERFTGELCASLSWASPSEIVARSAANGARPLDLRDDLYLRALGFRRAAPWAFIDPRWTVFRHRAPAINEFQITFTFPVMQYADKVLYHRDKQLLAAFQMTYVWHLWNRQLFTGVPAVIRLPWRSTPDEVETLTDQVRAMMRRALGRDGPSPRIEADMQRGQPSVNA